MVLETCKTTAKWKTADNMHNINKAATVTSECTSEDSEVNRLLESLSEESKSLVLQKKKKS